MSLLTMQLVKSSLDSLVTGLRGHLCTYCSVRADALDRIQRVSIASLSHPAIRLAKMAAYSPLYLYQNHGVSVTNVLQVFCIFYTLYDSIYCIKLQCTVFSLYRLYRLYSYSVQYMEEGNYALIPCKHVQIGLECPPLKLRHTHQCQTLTGPRPTLQPCHTAIFCRITQQYIIGTAGHACISAVQGK